MRDNEIIQYNLDLGKKDDYMIEKQKNLNIFNKLIHKISDTYKEDAHKLKTFILDEISDMPFFKTHPDLYGMDESEACIWAFHNNGAAKTVVLFNQYSNATDIEYDFQIDEDWIDAKDWMMGLALHLSELHKSSAVNRDVNFLFLSIPIAELPGQSHSRIMKQIIRRMVDFKVKYDLNYEVVLLSEAQPWQSNDRFAISTGFAGRMMPIIASKGKSTHVDTAYKGLNAISIANEVVKAIELNTEMSDAFNKRMTPPPAFIDFYNVKSSNVLSTPQYTIATFNWHFLKDDLSKKLCQLKELCAWSVEDAINQFNYSYNEYLRKQALPSYRECMHFDFEVVFVDELSNHQINCAQNDSSAKMMVEMMDGFKCDQPVVLIGMLESFYPVVSSASYFEQTLAGVFSESLTYKEIQLDITPYHMTTSGINLFKHSDTKHDRVLGNMPLKENALFDVLKENEILELEVLHIGPRAQQECSRYSRVDAEEIVPYLIDALITCIK